MPKPDAVATADVSAGTDSTKRTDNAIPSGWRRVSIPEVADIYGGGTPSTKVIEYWNGDIRWATPTDVTALNSRFISETAAHITEQGLRETRLRLLPAGTLLVTSRATIGARAIAAAPMATNQGFAALVCRTDMITAEFLYYQIGLLRPELRRLSSGSTFTELSRSSLRAVCFLLPPLTEQRQIAAILSSVDDAIERTNAVIEQTRLMKQALAQELLTRGIPGRHSRYKQTEVGEVPESWQVVRLRDCGQWFSGGTPTRDRADFWGGDLPWVSGKDMKRLRLSDAAEHITGAAVYAGASVAEARTILVVVRGMILAHTFPVAVLERPAAFNQDIKALRCRGDIEPEFLLQVLVARAAEFLQLVDEATHGTKRLASDLLLSSAVALPSLEEQQAIALILGSCDERVDAESQAVNGLEIVKSQLADRLLSGQVRVNAEPGLKAAVQ